MVSNTVPPAPTNYRYRVRTDLRPGDWYDNVTVQGEIIHKEVMWDQVTDEPIVWLIVLDRRRSDDVYILVRNDTLRKVCASFINAKHEMYAEIGFMARNRPINAARAPQPKTIPGGYGAW